MTKVLIAGNGKLGQFRFDTISMQQDRGIDLSFAYHNQLYLCDIKRVDVAITIGIGARGSIV